MSKTFRAWNIDQPQFLPPTVQDFVAKDHLAHFVVDLVKEQLDLIEITGTYGSERGQPPFDPRMMTALLLYSFPPAGRRPSADETLLHCCRAVGTEVGF